MNQRLKETLNHKYSNYIRPFFWQHGASEEKLREYMGIIQNFGIQEVCLESRPHPDYAGPKWWQDVDVIMDEARKRGMRVWVLDDSFYENGFVNKIMRNAPDELKRWYLLEKNYTVQGPAKRMRFEISTDLGHIIHFGPVMREEYKAEALVAVILAKHTEGRFGPVNTELVNVTDQVDSDGFLVMDIPDGIFDIYVYTKRVTAVNKGAYMVSLIDRDSVHLMIDGVYEAHYERYKGDFGKTFAGFFCDEPGFFNSMGMGTGGPGRGLAMPLPWSDSVRDEMETRLSGNLTWLVGLAHDCCGMEREIRLDFMDIVTKKYESCFSRYLGDWCADHGVEFIGHVIEDGSAHSSLGGGTGHYFRAMAGQHMSGIDVVLNQLLPDMDFGRGRFYHYTIPALAASCAHQSDRQEGRALCEIFGAFGWTEGLTMMKWMTDLMFSGGVNQFTPHAFSDNAFPDDDCPPHFYANGHNPQYRHMPYLFGAMNRAAHLLNGGKAEARVAILFSAEAQWAGSFRLPDELAEKLVTNQIMYEILPMDNLKKADLSSGRIKVGSADYDCLIVDSTDFLPDEYIEKLNQVSGAGIQVLYVNKIPSGFGGKKTENPVSVHDGDLLQLLSDKKTVVSLKPEKWLRAYKYVHPDMTLYYLANTSLLNRIDTALTIKETGKSVLYNPWTEELITPVYDEEGRMIVSLERGESFIYITGEDVPEGKPKRKITAGKALPDDYSISMASHDNLDCFIPVEIRKLTDVLSMNSHFSGIVRYETVFDGKAEVIDLGEAYEAAEVFVNGKSAGVRFSFPYVYDISELTVEGTNELRIEVATTAFGAVRDPLSLRRPIPPEGILGPVMIQ